MAGLLAGFALIENVSAQAISSPSEGTQFLINTAHLLFGGACAFVFVFAYSLRAIGFSRLEHGVGSILRVVSTLGAAIFAFWLLGYELIFSVEEGGLLGDFGSWRLDASEPIDTRGAQGAFWFFHMGLAAMTAVIASGSLAERVKLWPFLIFTAALAGLIYPVVASWVWGGGYFASVWRFYDAGGASIHLVAGAAALGGALVVGPRAGRFNAKSPWVAATPTIPLAGTAAGLSWIALFGVSTTLLGEFAILQNANRISVAFANLTIASAASILAAVSITQLVYRRPGLVTSICAMVAGIVSISADPVSPSLWQAAMIGAVGGVIVSVVPPFLTRMKVDDAEFIIPMHFLCGLWAILIAPWSNGDLNVLGQFIGAFAIAGFSVILSVLLWTALRYSLGVRLKSS